MQGRYLLYCDGRYWGELGWVKWPTQAIWYWDPDEPKRVARLACGFSRSWPEWSVILVQLKFTSTTVKLVFPLGDGPSQESL